MQITSLEIALVGIVVTVALNMIALAFSYGKLTSRVDAIASTLHDMREVIERNMALPTTVEEHKRIIEGIQATLRNGLTARVSAVESGLAESRAICKERHGRQSA